MTDIWREIKCSFRNDRYMDGKNDRILSFFPAIYPWLRNLQFFFQSAVAPVRAALSDDELNFGLLVMTGRN